MSDTSAIIELEHTTKVFSHHRRAGRLRRRRVQTTAVHDISLSIGAGEAVGYIGPNGAGKSTTIKMLTGILHPTSGRITVAGLSPQRDRVALARRIGVVFGHRTQLWWDLPVADSFDLLRSIYRVPADHHRRRLGALADMLELGPFLQQPVRQLSLGQRMRCELTAALLHDPAILYLDEPTVGLDVVSKARVRDFLATVNREQGVTVLLTTHDLDDVERLCHRLVVIDHGRVVHDTTVDEVKRRFAPYRTLVVDLADTRPPLELEGIHVDRVDGPRQWLRFHRDEHSAADVISRVAAAAPVVDLTVLEPDIEDVVKQIYEVPPPSGHGCE